MGPPANTCTVFCSNDLKTGESLSEVRNVASVRMERGLVAVRQSLTVLGADSGRLSTLGPESIEPQSIESQDVLGLLSIKHAAGLKASRAILIRRRQVARAHNDRCNLH